MLQWIFIFNCFKGEAAFEYITPTDPEQRGAQISIRFTRNVQKVHEELEKRGVVVRFGFNKVH